MVMRLLWIEKWLRRVTTWIKLENIIKEVAIVGYAENVA